MNPDKRECVIYGCNSSSTKDQYIRFFPFPPKDTTEYKIWMTTCITSYEKILSLDNPLVCSLHFSPQEIGQKRLHPNAFPRLNLPKEYYAAQDETEQKTEFLGKVTWEWMLRSQCYQNISRKAISDVTRDVRELLNIPRHVPNPLWIREFKYQPIISDSNGILLTAKRSSKSLIAEVIRDLKSSEEIKPQELGEGSPSGCFGDVSAKIEVRLDCEEVYESSLEGCMATKTKKDEIVYSSSQSEEGDIKEKTIDSYEDALEYLKPLQYFVKEGNEHLAAIGLLAQLQAIFNDPEQS